MTEDVPPLLPDKVRDALPPLYATEKIDDPTVHAKLFTPWAGWTWYVTEFDGEDALFGLVSGHEVELGYFSLSEIAALRGPGGLRAERDIHFAPQPLSMVRSELEGLREGPEEQTGEENPPPYTSVPTPAADPTGAPAIRLIETKLSGAWAEVTGDVITTPDQAARVLHGLIGDADREQFVALFLNGRHQVTHANIVSTGSANSAPVHPREVFKGAVLANASAIVVGHNHPSGNVMPSREDQQVSERLTDAGQILGVPVIDSLIVGPTNRFYSLKSGQQAHLDVRGPPAAEAATASRLVELERVCENLMQDIDEVLERAGEDWWDETVTSGTHHRGEAEKLLGRDPYEPLQDDAESDPGLG